MLLGENGILKNAEIAGEKYENAADKEEFALKDIENEIDVAGARETITLTQEQYAKLMDRLEFLENNSLKFPDYSRPFTTITTQGASWVASEDCVLVRFDK